METKTPLEEFENLVFNPVSISVGRIQRDLHEDFKDDPYWQRMQANRIDLVTNYNEHQDILAFPTVTMEDLFVQIDNEGKGDLVIEDHVSLVDTNQSYFHALYDNFGQFLAIKNYFPELKPMILVLEKIMPSMKMSYVDAILKFLKIKKDDIVSVKNYSSIRFKKITMTHFNTNSFSRGVLYYLSKNNPSVYNVAETGGSFVTAYLYVISRELKKFMQGLPEFKVAKQNKKVFVSRKPRRTMTEATRILKRFLATNGVTWDETMKMSDPQNLFKTINFSAFSPATVFSNLNEIDYRYISAEDEDYIENFFRSLDYEIVYVDDMTMKNQIELFASCTHIATLAGAGSLNSLFLKDQGTFIYLSTDTRYLFYHEDILDTITPNSIIVFDKRKEYMGSKKSAVEVINELKDNYLDRL